MTPPAERLAEIRERWTPPWITPTQDAHAPSDIAWLLSLAEALVELVEEPWITVTATSEGTTTNQIACRFCCWHQHAGHAESCKWLKARVLLDGGVGVESS